MNRILIAICTRQRPRMLQKCMRSLCSIEKPTDSETSILVIENDQIAQANTLILEIKKNCPFPIQHLLETQQGIPFARNRALKTALTEKFDYLVFIDDDEWVEPDWLTSLYGFALKMGGKAVIHGHVISDFPKGSPNHLMPLIQHKQKKTGTPLTSCATNNVIIPIELIRPMNLYFDEQNPFAGGEDVLFFFSAYQQGAKIYECNEAIVHEEVPLNRVSLKWLAKRKYWIGIGQLKRNLKKGKSPSILMIKAISSIILRFPVVALLLIAGNKYQFSRQYLKACKTCGTIGGILGKETDAYRHTDGN